MYIHVLSAPMRGVVRTGQPASTYIYLVDMDGVFISLLHRV